MRATNQSYALNQDEHYYYDKFFLEFPTAIYLENLTYSRYDNCFNHIERLELGPDVPSGKSGVLLHSFEIYRYKQFETR